MPPKKKPEKKKGQEDELVGYDINIMTLDQLKQYARLLEGEIEDMRRHCSFFQKTEDELVELMRIADEDLKYDKEILLFKDVELEKLKLNFLKHLREKREVPMYMEHSSSEKKEKISSEISARLEEEQDRHTSETKKLKSIILEKSRQLEALKVKIEMARRDAKYGNEECLRKIYSSQKNALEQAVERFAFAKRKTEDEFKRTLEIINLEAREGKIRGERNFQEACLAFKQKLHNYYKEITKQDLDTIKKLKNKIIKIEENIRNSKVLLEKAKEENRALKELAKFKTKKEYNTEIVVKFNACPLRMMKALKIHNKMEKLAIENQNLEKQIKDITERTENLRRQFTIALGKVRDSAEIKVAFLDKKFSFLLDDTENKTLLGLSESKFGEKSDVSVTGTARTNLNTSNNL